MIARKNRRTCTWQNGLVIITAAAAITCAAMLLLAPLSSFVQLWLAIRSVLLIPLLNFLPVYLCMLLLYFITNSLVGAIAPVSLVAMGLAVINRVKIQMRGDPLVHWDFLLAGEVFGIAGGFGWLPIAAASLAVVASAVVIVWAFRRFRAGRTPWLVRTVGTAGCLLTIWLGYRMLYINHALYSFLPVHGTEYSEADVSNSKGLIYTFLYNLNRFRIREPEGYDSQEVAAFIGAYEEELAPEAPENTPHVIMVMSEALSDLSRHDSLRFTSQDPLEHFQRLGEEGVAGHLVVPGRGGGTADTEADVLTGRPTRYLRHAPYAYRLYNSQTEALPSVLGQLGYETFALHPGYAWFYNRQNVYPLLGFDEMVFEDAFTQADHLDYYMRESATFDMLLSMLDERLTDDELSPVFGFCVTIQNHGPYSGRFLEEGTEAGVFRADASLSDDEIVELANYFAAIQDADAQIGRLAAYLEALDEPAVLVCFGDHLPVLSSRLYDLLAPGMDAEDGSLAREIALNRVPFIVWQNSAARAERVLPDDAQALLPDGGVISSNFLGAYVLELLGLDGHSAFFSYVNDVRGQYPVLKESISFTAEGEPVTAEALPETLLRYRQWVHHATVEK